MVAEILFREGKSCAPENIRKPIASVLTLAQHTLGITYLASPCRLVLPKHKRYVTDI